MAAPARGLAPLNGARTATIRQPPMPALTNASCPAPNSPASTLASGPVFGGQQQQIVACEVVNLGSTPITFLTEQLVGQFKSPLTLNFNDCGAALRAGGTCSFQANVNDQGTAPNQAASCKVVIREAKTNVRGTMVALDPAHGRPLSQTDLR